MKTKRLWTILTLCLIGMILGTLGTWSVPLGHGASAFWPALVVQVAGGVWFGGWGVLAGVLFPIVTNAITGVGPMGIYGFVPANLAQALIPAWAFRHFAMDPILPGRKGIAFYLLWGAAAPALAGGILGATAIVLHDKTGWSAFPLLTLKWCLPHTIVSSLIGIPAMRVFTPLWRDLGAMVHGWWDWQGEDIKLNRTYAFVDLPIQLKLVMVMCGAGLLPLALLGLVALAEPAENSTMARLAPLVLTISLVASILAVGFLSAQVIRPLRDLRASVDSLIQNRGGSLSLARGDEIGQVARSFELLLEDQRRAEDKLRESIAERTRAEGALQVLLEEKTVLLKEVHHRVKNNLQIVSSLLNLQSAYIQNPEALESLRETSNRIRAMSLLHETLYHSENLARVDFRAYIEAICVHVVRSWGSKAGRITLEQKLAPVGLDLDQAVPCGLILNELVSNAIKHAFPDDRAGRIVVRLEETPAGLIELTVTDDGIGMPPDTENKRSQSLGLQLISSLSGQLHGMLAISRDKGTSFRLVFAKRTPKPPPGNNSVNESVSR